MEEKIVGSDNTIALSWTKAEIKPLEVYKSDAGQSLSMSGLRLIVLTWGRDLKNKKTRCGTWICLVGRLSLDENGYL